MEFVISLITSAFIGGAAGALGALMVSKKMSLVGGPLGHLALPGVAVALSFGFNIFFGSLFSVVVGVFIIWLLEQKTELSIETVTGVVFATGVALGLLLLPLERAEEAVVGDITQVTVLDLFLSTVLIFLTFVFIKKLASQIVLLSISGGLAQSKGVHIRVVTFIYLLMIALTVALEVKILGILLTAALFVIPAAASRNITRSLRPYILISSFFGVVSCSLGVVGYELTTVAAGPLMIVSAGVIFLFCFLVRKSKKRYSITGQVF